MTPETVKLLKQHPQSCDIRRPDNCQNMGQKTAPEGRNLRLVVKHVLSVHEDLGSNSSITNKMNQFNF